MSATLDPAWLKTVDFTPKDPRRATDLTAEDIVLDHPARLWGAVKRVSPGLRPAALKSDKDRQAYAGSLAALVRDRVRPDGTVLVFLNTVGRAQTLYRTLRAIGVEDAVLVHSRFRPEERRGATAKARAAPRVIVATQALEAGVDLTSAVLISELAPWSSMVQRFGRCNRYGECGERGAELVWIDLPPDAEAPYEAEELGEARARLQGLEDGSPEALSRLEPGILKPSSVIRQRDLLDLFDTEPDLSGFDVDVATYVRDAEDVDVRLFWREIAADGVPEGAKAAPATRHELCPASVTAARTLVKRKARVWRADRLKRGRTIWTLIKDPRLVRPGQELMVTADAGGYDPVLGLQPESTAAVQPLPLPAAAEAEAAAGLDDDLDTDIGSSVPLEAHSRHVQDEMQRLCAALKLQGALRDVLVEAALWHDRGKAHGAFQQMLSPGWRSGQPLLAKSADRPKIAAPAKRGGTTPDGEDLRRPRFRHELASMLAYLAEKDWAREADLAAYLIAAHHGKVRMRLRALPDETTPADDTLFARGVWSGDALPPTSLAETTAPAVTLDLDIMQLGEGPHGASWSARTQALLDAYGPFTLAWLESLVRIADWRASRAEAYAALNGPDLDIPWDAAMAEGEEA